MPEVFAGLIQSNFGTAGNLEVKRVWTQRPAGATGKEFADVAVKLNWTGCNAFTVAHST